MPYKGLFIYPVLKCQLFIITGQIQIIHQYLNYFPEILPLQMFYPYDLSLLVHQSKCSVHLNMYLVHLTFSFYTIQFLEYNPNILQSDFSSVVDILLYFFHTGLSHLNLDNQLLSYLIILFVASFPILVMPL